MKVKVDPEACIGCQMCVQVAPDLFEMKEDKAVAKVEEVPEDKQDECKQASEQCPVDAIPIEE
ncbi:MAG: ferredoxin [Candidatus Omnitrophica bacterium]|nr:ferredoxin [Candidatus Omnitrophota bacterium]